MGLRISALALCTATVIGAAGALRAEESSFGEDLTATIVLQGQPCDKVIDAKRQGDSDYIASCKDGNRYHVYVDSTGRVVVQKL